VKTAGLLATRRSLVERLADWGDQLRWQEFFDTYWKLIYSAARQSGLTNAEAQEVVQVTVITVAKNIDNSNMIRQLARLKAGCCRSRAGESPINFENVNRATQSGLVQRTIVSRRRSNTSPIRGSSISMRYGTRSGKRTYSKQRSRV
jgi:hypothetical protein